MRTPRLLYLILLGCSLLLTGRAFGYSLLTHEELIDLTWKSSIVPLLLSRYPTLTPAQLEYGRAYAYGGCVIQDIGYYPFGATFFSNLTHYVRSGDFVVNLFRDAGNANELAFAVGALSHYIGDTVGHAEATNLSVPVEFPRLRARYGPVVNYAEGEHQHVQTEFAFDIAMISHRRLAPLRYLRSVGLQVPRQQLALAFYQTYGLKEVDGRGARVNVSGYRFAVRWFIPRIAYALNVLHRNHEPAEPGTAELLGLQAEIDRISRENHWDEFRRDPGPGTYLLAGFAKIVPKVGALKLLAVKGPTEATEQEYIHSVLASTAALAEALHRFTPPSAVASAHGGEVTETAVKSTSASAALQPGLAAPVRDPLHPLPNRDLDTGSTVRPAGYPLTDSTYATLLHRLAQTPDQAVPPEVKSNILKYFSDLSLPFATRRDPARWTALQQDLVTLRGMATQTEQAPFATYGDHNDVDR